MLVDQTSTVAAALALAARGWPVHPCSRDKRPITPHGYRDATTDPTTVRAMFSRPGAALVAVATGRPSGLVAVDVDPRHGGDRWLRAVAHRLPATLTHGTPSGGIHLIFRDPPGVELRCSQGLVAPGVDGRANGGSVIFAGPGYTVRDASAPAAMPLWLAAMCRRPEPPPPPPGPRRSPCDGDGSRYGLAALAGECEAIATAPFGAQEGRLNAGTFAIGRLVAAGELAEAFALAELVAAGRRMPSQPGREPWRPADVERKVRRSLAEGMRQPRRVLRRVNGRAGQ